MINNIDINTKENIMNKYIIIALILATSSLTAGVKDSKHNLSSTGTGNSLDATTEVCVFCHTPHGSSAGDVPLWNKSLPESAGFTSYSSSTIDGGTTDVGSVSIACLSCHDGVQSMDVMINAPGSGGYNAAGASLAGTWSGTTVSATGQLTGIGAIGTDLSNDHPVGIQYGGGGITNSNTTIVDSDFTATQKATINQAPVWWDDVASPTQGGAGKTGNIGTRDKTDMILYTRVDAALANESEPFVECATCHDPHQSDTATFLRIDNTGSAVCLACHVK